ncbi:MAG TPA: hypothetical protein VKT72_07000, partial [Candidatus Baltobacteraceae bacterium]|nr:hypothetical protein [Candidatus Baltobacteraceae bacterium]
MRTWLLITATLAAIIALLFTRPHATSGPPMRDFEAYYAAGATWNAGANPYSQAIWSAEKHLPGVNAARYEALPFVGPPVTLPFFGLFARMPFALANALWRALLVIVIALYALLVLRMAGRKVTAFSLLAVAVAAVGFAPCTSALALGQLALPAAFLTVLAVVQPAAAFFAWIQPNIAIALAGGLFSRRGFVTFAASSALFAGACIAVVGIRGFTQYAAVLDRHDVAERFIAIQITPAAVAYGFGAAPSVAAATAIVAALGAFCAWVLLMRRVPDALSRFCVTCALLPLVMPYFHEQDLAIVFVPAVIYALRATARLMPLVLLAAMLVATDWLGLAQRPDGTLQTLLLAGAFGCVLVALHDRPQAGMMLTPLAVL